MQSDPMDEGERIHGSLGMVTSFDDLTGTGVITTMYGDDHFFERSSIRSKDSLVVGQTVEFVAGTDSDYNYLAFDITTSNRSLFPGGDDGFDFNEAYGGRGEYFREVYEGKDFAEIAADLDAWYEDFGDRGGDYGGGGGGGSYTVGSKGIFPENAPNLLSVMDWKARALTSSLEKDLAALEKDYEEVGLESAEGEEDEGDDEYLKGWCSVFSLSGKPIMDTHTVIGDETSK